MENATKALLIAAAILVAIIIISIGIAVVNQGQEAVSSANMDEATMEAFNAKFETYQGTTRTVADVNGLLSKVVSHNQNAANVNEPTVTVSVDGTEVVGATSDTFTRISGTSRYTVQCTYADGLVTSIAVTTNQ